MNKRDIERRAYLFRNIQVRAALGTNPETDLISRFHGNFINIVKFFMRLFVVSWYINPVICRPVVLTAIIVLLMRCRIAARILIEENATDWRRPLFFIHAIAKDCFCSSSYQIISIKLMPLIVWINDENYIKTHKSGLSPDLAEQTDGAGGGNDEDDGGEGDDENVASHRAVHQRLVAGHLFLGWNVGIVRKKAPRKIKFRANVDCLSWNIIMFR